MIPTGLAGRAFALAALATLAAGCGADGDGTPGTDPAAVRPSSAAVGAVGAAATPSPSVPVDGTAAPFAVGRIDGRLVDPARDRPVPYRVFAPLGLDGALPVVLVSHGGIGSARGHTTGGHVGTALAERGFVAVHVGHLPSDTPAARLVDRPADVSHVLDRLAVGDVTLPPGVGGTPDLERVGHAGHSYGAYTSHAVGGATFERVHRDARVDAIAPISPQGAGRFGAFDRGAGDDSWATVAIPAYVLVGGDELDTTADGRTIAPGWRLTPFERYPRQGDKLATVIEGQDHADMWNDGSDAVKRFVGASLARFFSVYVKGDVAADACLIGHDVVTGVTATTERKPDPDASRLVDCP